MVKLDKRTWKENYFTKLKGYMNEYSKCVVLGVDNVQSRQMQNVRMALRGKAELLMGKNTMIRKCLRELAEEKPELEELLVHIVGNIGFCFTNSDVLEIKAAFDANQVQSSARAGIVAPVDVTIPAGPTGMGPEKTSFFQALNLPTKITKGVIEIMNPVTVVTAGNRVGISESKLLNMLSISPFWYQIEISQIMDNGSIYPVEVLSITMDAVRDSLLQAAASGVAALSLGLNLPNAASAPHMIMNAFKNALAIAVATEVTFEEAKLVKAYLENPGAFAAAAPSGGGGGDAPAPAAAAAPVEESEEEEMEMGLFD